MFLSRIPLEKKKKNTTEAVLHRIRRYVILMCLFTDNFDHLMRVLPNFPQGKIILSPLVISEYFGGRLTVCN